MRSPERWQDFIACKSAQFARHRQRQKPVRMKDIGVKGRGHHDPAYFGIMGVQFAAIDAPGATQAQPARAQPAVAACVEQAKLAAR